MKSWIKGGLWGLLVYVLIQIPVSLTKDPETWIIYFSSTNPLAFWIDSILRNGIFRNTFIAILLSIISYFLIGALIGLIVGKIKSKNPKNKVK